MLRSIPVWQCSSHRAACGKRFVLCCTSGMWGASVFGEAGRGSNGDLSCKYQLQCLCDRLDPVRKLHLHTIFTGAGSFKKFPQVPLAVQHLHEAAHALAGVDAWSYYGCSIALHLMQGLLWLLP